eukprot:TRINITY_DN72105_c0_g1_i1.p1 TRINITY_DN72105_c0_g1~~TRINITY_DN72105_c0_g1_i1.p1  ORF type:complete len:381 (+),score=61.97 TRINITY_DN72105_c0_g1_i1:165-1307(+)
MRAQNAKHLSSPDVKADAFWMQSPISQASSAPMTPVLSNLPEPVIGPYANFPFLPKGDSADSSSPYKFERTLSGHSTQAPDEMEPLPCTPTGDEHIFVPVLPPLQSELGRWAQSIVLAEEWLVQQCREQQAFMAVEKDFVLDNSSLKADTIGLAYRRSKNHSDRDHTIPGLEWGSGVTGLDEGDGWVQVGHYFLPKELDNVAVLVPRTKATQDAPALTADGCAVDLHTGAAISFSQNAVFASLAAELKDNIRMLHAARLAHSACEAEALIEADGVCTIDAAGLVRNHVLNLEEEQPSKSSRLKHFFRRMQYRRSSACGHVTDQHCRLCVGSDGKTFFLLYPEGTTACRVRIPCKRRSLGQQQLSNDSDAVIIDADGIVHF